MGSTLFFDRFGFKQSEHPNLSDNAFALIWSCSSFKRLLLTKKENAKNNFKEQFANSARLCI